ncbi:MAG: hypothetical protein OEX12_08870 [Gammaproteobacteria bacterium]|nr:hypothetical protein [Gammaproteobacteria bacterium]
MNKPTPDGERMMIVPANRAKLRKAFQKAKDQGDTVNNYPVIKDPDSRNSLLLFIPMGESLTKVLEAVKVARKEKEPRGPILTVLQHPDIIEGE